MYSRFELNGILKNKREDEWLIQFFNENKIEYIDTSPFFIHHIKEKGDIDDLFVSDGHYNDKGDSLVALSLLRNLNKFRVDHK